MNPRLLLIKICYTSCTIIKKLAHERNTTILMVTHDNKVIELADRIITMDEGRLINL